MYTLLKYVIEIFKGIFPYLFVSVKLLPINTKIIQNTVNYNKHLGAVLSKNRKKLLYHMPNIEDKHLYYEDDNTSTLDYYRNKYKLNIVSPSKNKLKYKNPILKDKINLFNHENFNGNKSYRLHNKWNSKKYNTIYNIDFFKYKK